MADSVNYTLPNFLDRPTDTITPLLHGMQLGQTIASERNRLQQAQQLAIMEAASRSEALQQRAQVEQQQIAMEQAKTQAMTSLQEKELAQHQQTIDMATQQMARKFAAQERFKQMMAQGVDPARALLEVGPDLGESLTGAAQLYKATLPEGAVVPPSVQKFGDRSYLVHQGPRGVMQYTEQKPQPGSMGSFIQAVPVKDAEGNTIKGLTAFPSASGGGTRIMRTPDNQTRLAAARLKELEKNVMNMTWMQSEKDPPKAKKETDKEYATKVSNYHTWLNEYARLKRMVDAATFGNAFDTFDDATGLPPKAGAPARAGGTNMIPVTDPDGIPGMMPESAWPEAQKAGYKRR